MLQLLSVLFSCTDKTESIIVRGKIIVNNNEIPIQLGQYFSGKFGEENELRLVFLSKPYPLEGEDVEDLTLVVMDIITDDQVIDGVFEFDGDSAVYSMTGAYGVTHLTIENYETVSGIEYEFNDGTLEVEKDGDNYKLQFSLIQGDQVIEGVFEGPITERLI